MTYLDEALKRFDNKFRCSCSLPSSKHYSIDNDGIEIKSFLRSELERAVKEEREQFMEELKDLQVFVTDPDINARRDVVHKIDTILASLTEGKVQS